MPDYTEITKINQFLSITAPIVISFTKTLLYAAGLEITDEGSGPNLAFSIKSGERETKFFLQNLLLEIATIDRDAVPLKFDERLADFDFFMSKTADIVESKLSILFLLLGESDVDAAVETILSSAYKYERICIIKVDPKPF